MKKFAIRAACAAAFLLCLLAFSVVGASATSSNAQQISSGNLASAVTSYKQSNPSAAQHTITTSHKVVYSADAYFKDMVNASNSKFSCYGKTGSDAVLNRLSDLGVRVQEVSDASAPSAKEILVGVVKRDAQSAFLPMVDVNEYAIIVTQNQIMLLAWQDAALKVCVDTFLAYLNTCYQNGSSFSLPVGFVGIGVANSTWKVDFPRPTGTGIALGAGQFVNDDSLQFLYTGNGVTRSAYLTYCTQLEADGFALVWQNTVGNNEFRGYQNTAKGIALYVAYNDYTYKAEFDALYQANYGTYDDGFAPEFEKCIRIVSSPRSAITVPAASINSQQSYTKVTDSYLTMLSIAETQVGSGYVIMLEDGRFVIIDGGNVSTKKNGVYPESQAIWDAMLALYKKAYGASAVPTAQRPLHVAAWYLTHAHADHYNAFYYMVDMIGADASKKAVFKIDYVIANMIGDKTMFENSSTQWGYNNSTAIHNMKNKVGGFTFLKVHTGQRIYFANLMIEVLMTFEDHLPNTIYNTNDTNTITRFHFHSSAAAAGSVVTSFAGKAVTVMFLGDSWRPASRFLCAMYGSYLKSDISQIAHHGNIGCEKELYAQIAPTGVLFNHDLSMFTGYVWGTTTNTNPETQHAYAVDQYVIKELGSVLYVWAAVKNVYPTIKLTATGPQYDSAFALLAKEPLSYSNVNAAVSSQNGFLKFSHTHTHGAWQKYDETLHKRVCACGDTEYEAHKWNSGTVTSPATHTAFGTKTYTCTDCSEIREEDIPKLTAHEYGAWEKHSDAYHKHTCSCGEVEYAAHTWNGGEVAEPATHLKAGTKTYTCTACAHTKESSIPKLTAHGYGTWTKHSDTQHKRVCACGDVEYAAHAWDEGEITQAPTHLALGVKSFRCETCDESKQESIAKTPTHSFGEWVITKEATIDTEGERVRECACGEKQKEAVPTVQLPDTEQANGDVAPDTAQDGLETGALIGIISGSAAALGGGGFCLYWFALRKKKKF